MGKVVRRTARLGLVSTLVAASLVGGWISPARAITVPRTLAEAERHTFVGADIHQEVLDFPATHIAFSWVGDHGARIRFRTVEPAGSAFEWTRVTQNHDAERGDTHFSGVIEVDRPEVVEWQLTSGGRTGVDDVTFDYMNTLDGPRETVEIPATAEAAAGTPAIVTRAQWGADESLKRTSGGCKRQFHRVQQLFVHHTAGSNFDSNPRATMRAIYQYHVVRQGWCDVGYNFVIASDGTIFEGRWARSYKPWETHDSEDLRNRAAAGAHVAEYNSGSVGISLMGNFMNVAPTPAARRSLAEILAWEADRHDLPPKGSHTYRNPETGLTRKLPFIAGHRDAGQTSCPGSVLYRKLDSVRRDVKAVIGEGKAATELSLEGIPKTEYGGTTTLSGKLVGSDGAGLASRSIRTYTSEGGAWVPGPKAATETDGSYSMTFGPTENTKVVALYDGDGRSWGAQSSTRAARVKPNVTLEPEGGTRDPFSGTTHYPNGTTEVGLTGTVTPAHNRKKVTVKISEVAFDGTETLLEKRTVRISGSTYSYTFTLPQPASGRTFRAVGRFVADRDHAGSASPPATFSVGS